jgi:hypothetical protein
MGTLNENEEYREQTDKLFIPHSACGFHALSLGTGAKGKRGVPPPLLAAGVSRRKRQRSARGPRLSTIPIGSHCRQLPHCQLVVVEHPQQRQTLVGVQAAAKFHEGVQ